MNRMTKYLLPAVASVGLLAPAAHASLTVTEIFTGLSGEDGTADWFEVTNTGVASVDTGNFVYDDASPTLASGGALDSFTLAPGESAVFLVSDDLTDGIADSVTYSTVFEEFAAIWGAVANVGITNGGGGLGQGSDEVNILEADTGTIIDTLAYASGGNLETWDDADGDNTPAISVVGVNGAYESNAFFNDNLGLPNDSATLIGSPGVVPEPASLALAALGGFALLSRRG